MDFLGQRFEDLQQISLPAIAQHIECVATKLALQTLDIEMHRHKWTLTVQGLKGTPGEDESVTREACVKLAKEHLQIDDASVYVFAACHRRAKKENAGIIMRFKDLQQRNIWLQNAKHLKTHEDKISIAPDLPPVLRPLKKSCFRRGKICPHLRKKVQISAIFGSGPMSR